MNEKLLTVHEVAELTGTTVRTLHYYDEIGLLKPSIVTDARYRLYTQNDLSRLQEILFFREVGFGLKDVKKLLEAANYSREEALENHLQILEAKRERIDALIDLVNKEIAGATDYSFAAFSNSKILDLQEQYREEMIQRWGDTESYKEYQEIFSKRSRKKQQEAFDSLLNKSQEVFERLAMYEKKNPASGEVQAVVKEWQEYISENFYQCDNQMLTYLGALYVNDERFSAFINRFGSNNLAEYFSKAIKIYCSKQSDDKNMC